MRLIDADALERMGYVLTRTYQQDKETMVYETKNLSDVPSAQPEIIRCGECKHYTAVMAHCEIRGKGLYLIRGMEDFCSRAERRTDG